MMEDDYCFECGKKFEDGEAVSGSVVDGFCCKGGCIRVKSSNYNLVNPGEIIKSVWKIPEKGDKNMSIKLETGTERKYATGAKKQNAEGKGTPVLFPGDAYLEVCRHFEDGAIHYGGRNWEKGIPLSSFIDSIERHIAQEKMGLTDESHDRAIAWNAICYLATKLRIKAGILPVELDDLCGVYGNKNYKLLDKYAALAVQYNKPEPKLSFEDYKIAEMPDNGWYVVNIVTPCFYLHKDLKFHRGTDFNTSGCPPYGCAPGYYSTKQVAEAFLRAYLNKKGNS